jgi:hypothetical protein
VRLGASRDDSVEVQRHPFFAAIDWAALDRMEAPPPWVPMVSDGLDLRHFDPIFVNESISQSVAVGGAMEEVRHTHPLSLSPSLSCFSHYSHDRTACVWST